jgi:hypothetical protein
MSFSSETPDEKIAPLVIAAIFVGQAAASAAIAWGTTRGLDNAFNG